MYSDRNEWENIVRRGKAEEEVKETNRSKNK
jgi:hypothetical protein